MKPAVQKNHLGGQKFCVKLCTEVLTLLKKLNFFSKFELFQTFFSFRIVGGKNHKSKKFFGFCSKRV